MSVKETIFQVAVAALTVIGFYGVLHSLLAWLLTPRELGSAVILTHMISPAELDILLCEARRALLGRGKRVVLAMPRRLWENGMRDSDEYAEIIEKYGVSVCLSEPSATPS
jgi:hypothetical protein